MKSRFRVFGAVLMVVLLGAVGFLVFQATLTNDDCPPETADPDGYLHKICEYIRANEIDVSPGDPTGYEILRTDTSTQDGRAVIRVFLNCCYMGDIAIVDQETGEVVDFWLGDQ